MLKERVQVQVFVLFVCLPVFFSDGMFSVFLLIKTKYRRCHFLTPPPLLFYHFFHYVLDFHPCVHGLKLHMLSDIYEIDTSKRRIVDIYL